MSLSDKVKAAKGGASLFDDISPDRIYALKVCSRISTMIFNERKRRKMTQAEFAAFCGVTQAMVSKWESGEYNFSVVAWAELSHKLDIPFSPMKSSPISHSTMNGYNSISSEVGCYKSYPNLVDFTRYRDMYYSELKQE